MLQLIEFFAKNRYFIVFILLEVFCIRCIIETNNYANVKYFNSANAVVGRVSAVSNSVSEFLNLRDVNNTLANENRQLRELLTQLQQADVRTAPKGYNPDSAFVNRFKFITIGQVVSNSTHRSENYFTINKGTADGVREGMGVATSAGVAGRIKYCEEKYSVATSVLHSSNMISAKLTRSGEIGVIKWENIGNPAIVQMRDVQRTIKIAKGDTVVASDQNLIYPAGMMVGRIKRIALSTDQAHFDVDVELGTNFRKLSYVYIVENKLIEQQKNPEKKILEPEKK
jgi:rod shape-determining protein MreC